MTEDEAKVCDCPQGPLTDEDVAAFGQDTDDDGAAFCWRCHRLYGEDEPESETA